MQTEIEILDYERNLMRISNNIANLLTDWYCKHFNVIR